MGQENSKGKIVAGAFAIDNNPYQNQPMNQPNPIGQNQPMNQSYLNNVSPDLIGNYGPRQSQYSNFQGNIRQSAFTTLPQNVHMQSVRGSEINLPKSGIQLNSVNQNVYTKDLRQSIVEVQNSKKQIEREYYNMLATGPERFLTAEDLESVIGQLKEENLRLAPAEEECKALRVEKEMLRQSFPQFERVKQTLEKQFIANDIKRDNNMDDLRRREVDLQQENKRLREVLYDETRQVDEFQKTWRRLNIDDIDRQKRDENNTLRAENTDKESEYVNILNSRKQYMKMMEKVEEEMFIIKNDNTALGLHLDSLVSNVRNNQIQATSDIRLEDDELRTLKMLKDNMMVKYQTTEKENEMLMLKIQKQNWNYSRIKFNDSNRDPAMENFGREVVQGSIVNRPQNERFMQRVDNRDPIGVQANFVQSQ